MVVTELSCGLLNVCVIVTEAFVWFTHVCVVVTELSCDLLTSVWLLLSFRVVYSRLCGCYSKERI